MIRRCLRFAALGAALGAGWLAAGPAAAAPATGAGTASAAAAGRAGARPHPWIAITSLSPTIAAPKGKVIVSGIVANPTSAALQGLSVQLWSSAVALSSRGSMHSYLTAASAAGLETQVPGAQVPLPGRVPPHGTQQWKLTLDVAQTGIRGLYVVSLCAGEPSGGAPSGVSAKAAEIHSSGRALTSRPQRRTVTGWPSRRLRLHRPPPGVSRVSPSRT